MPIGIAATEYYYYLLHDNGLTIISKVTGKVV